MNTVIRTLPQLQQAQSDAWVYGMIVAGISLAIAFIVALLVNWRTDRRDFMTRRVIFIILGLVGPCGYWLYNMQVIVPKIQNPGFQNMFKTTNLTILIVALIAFYVVGILSMTITKRGSKWRSILPKKFQ